ncbi:hypothetical protein N665_0599s0009, partial [Sinapis alba]
KVRQLFIDEDASLILNMKPNFQSEDQSCWGFTLDGFYSTKSGYKLIETMQTALNPDHITLPPIEKRIWSNTWKLKTTSKIKHVVWRALAGALAVDESICHTLFTCLSALDTWKAVGLPLPPRGLSPNSVFLNIHYLLVCIKSKDCPLHLKRIIPWILWHIWKARNALVFEKIRLDPPSILMKAEEESKSWYDANFPNSQSLQSTTENHNINLPLKEPPLGSLKCNIGASWSAHDNRSGASWIVRDMRNREMSELWANLWAVDSICSMRMDNIIFESSFVMARIKILNPCHAGEISELVHQILTTVNILQAWSLVYALPSRNIVATKIAESVTIDHIYQSYIANNSPWWLTPLISAVAVASDA